MELKWTLFKDALPSGEEYYCTDFTEVWISNIHRQVCYKPEQMRSKHPEYAWAYIPIPPVPKKKVEFHECISKCKGYVCNGDVDQCFLIFTELEDDTYKKVFTCPFCGFRPGKRS